MPTIAVPGKDFTAFQPGPLDAGAGWRPHRMELPLHVEAGSIPPEGGVLRLEFAAGYGPCPDIAVELDGAHRGFFHPEVRREDRSEVYRHGPIAGDVALEVPLPAAWLTPGEHVLAITTTMDVPAAIGPVSVEAGERPRHREQFGHHFGSGIMWHAITLEPATSTVDVLVVDLVATPLYVHGDGGLSELIELTITVPPGAERPRRAVVNVGGRDHGFDLTRTERTFGHVRERFAVPEFTGEILATVRVDGGPDQEFPLQACRKWTLHFIPHVHLDVGYTDLQGKVLELHSRNLDRALAALDASEDFAFSIDGSLIVTQYLATRSPERAERILDALCSGRLTVNAFHSLFLSGVAGLEEIYRAAYAAARLRDEHGVPVAYANLTDVPSYSAAVPGILGTLGIDSFVGIENHHRGGNADSDEQHLASPVMWEGLDGTRVLTHFSDTYSQLRFMLGDPQTVEGGAHAFCRLLSRYDRPDYLPHDLAVIGTHADNEDLADGDAGFAARWNAVYTYPRVEVSTMADYLDSVRPLADRLPVWRGDGGSYWEDGVGTGATVTAEYRRVQTALPAAEGLAALVARTDPAYRPHREALDAAWESALYGCEHTWTWAHANAHPHGHQVADQLDWKRHQVHSAHRTALDETRRALSQLAELVTTDGPTLLVHNPLGWARDIEAESEIVHKAPSGVDAEVLTDCNGLRRVRVTVPDVPAFGYRAVPVGEARTLTPGEEDGSGAGGTGADETDWQPIPAALDTDRWHVAFDTATGAVTGLRRRDGGRELLDTAGEWSLGDVLYVLNGPESLTRGEAHEHSGVPHTHEPAPRTTIQGRRPVAPAPDLTVHRAAMRPVGVRRTYDGWRIRAVGAAPSMPRIEVDVLLRDDSDRIDVSVDLDKDRVLAKESVYVAFPFAATDPRFRYDRQQGWVDPALDHTPGACNDWFTTQYGVVVEDADGSAIAWTAADAPLFTIGDVVRGAWHETFAPASAALFSWPLNNYWPTNTPPEQDGRLVLRYAFTPLPSFDPVAASRFGREVRAPAVVNEVNWLDKFDRDPRPLPADAASLFHLDLPEAVHATVAEARAGGLLLRLQNLSGAEQTVPLPDSAILCRADERELGPLDGTVHIAAWQVASVILRDGGPAPTHKEIPHA